MSLNELDDSTFLKDDLGFGFDKESNLSEDVLNNRMGRPLPVQFERMVDILEEQKYPTLKLKDRQRIWDSITEDLNVFGHKKSTQKWRKTLADWKHSIKKKISENKELNSLEKRVVELFMNQKREMNDDLLMDNFCNKHSNIIIQKDGLIQIKDEPLDFFENCEENIVLHAIENDSDYIIDQAMVKEESETDLHLIKDCNNDGTQIVECKPEIPLYNSTLPSPTTTYSQSPTTSDDLTSSEINNSHNLYHGMISLTEHDPNVMFESHRMTRENQIINHVNELNQHLPNSNISVTTSSTRPLSRLTTSSLNLGSSINNTLPEVIDPPPLVSIMNPNKKFKCNISSETQTPNKTNEINQHILEKVTRVEARMASIDLSLKRIASAMEILASKKI